jgi:hypothetical protein
MTASLPLSLSGGGAALPAVRDPWALVPSLGNLDAYVSAVNRLPMLTAETYASRLPSEGTSAQGSRTAGTKAPPPAGERGSEAVMEVADIQVLLWFEKILALGPREC